MLALTAFEKARVSIIAAMNALTMVGCAGPRHEPCLVAQSDIPVLKSTHKYCARCFALAELAAANETLGYAIHSSRHGTACSN